VANVHFERDVLQAAKNPYFPDFHFTFQVSKIASISNYNNSISRTDTEEGWASELLLKTHPKFAKHLKRSLPLFLIKRRIAATLPATLQLCSWLSPPVCPRQKEKV